MIDPELDPDAKVFRSAPDAPADKSLRDLFRATFSKYRRDPQRSDALNDAVEQRLMDEVRTAMSAAVVRLPDDTYTLHPAEARVRERAKAGRWTAALSLRLRGSQPWDAL
jgi:hypothetical protein